ncbi:MAG: pantoate--beta-alanine ligase [candidate division WOR-3 bacterium]|nr:pantoate--beta-alanine ligase [candidate division WOR-3 bacterium]MCX7757684.1 pantoate--beta-alanine ligase [candidate division WOR-3 bacterium]
MTTKVVRSIAEMQKIAQKLHRKGKTIGFVPTMGYLHLGHLSLVRVAKRYSDVVVVSVFVNPIQFGPQEDFNVYPRDFKRDRMLLSKEGVSYIFYPQARTMYPKGYKTYVEVKELSEKLCGRFRPGHFIGVTTVVAKLFNIVQPDIAVFGQKDAQQAVIIKKMVKDLNFPVKIVVAPTVREKDGLALSSRNVYLTPQERKKALILYQALKTAQSLIKQGNRDPQKILHTMYELINSVPEAKVDYIEIVDLDNLEPVSEIKDKVLIALAVRIGKARLIDNLVVKL